jgi:hypothetical protein
VKDDIRHTLGHVSEFERMAYVIGEIQEYKRSNPALALAQELEEKTAPPTDADLIVYAALNLPPRDFLNPRLTSDQRKCWVSLKQVFQAAGSIMKAYFSGKAIPPEPRFGTPEHEPWRLAWFYIDLYPLVNLAWEQILKEASRFGVKEDFSSPGVVIQEMMRQEAAFKFGLSLRGEFRFTTDSVREDLKAIANYIDILQGCTEEDPLERRMAISTGKEGRRKKAQIDRAQRLANEVIEEFEYFGVQFICMGGIHDASEIPENTKLREKLAEFEKSRKRLSKQVYKLPSYGWRNGKRIKPTGKAGTWA